MMEGGGSQTFLRLSLWGTASWVLMVVRVLPVALVEINIAILMILEQI